MEFTICIIDDEPNITYGIKLALEDKYRIVEFGDAETGIKAIGTDPPDLILLDVGLPGMNGVEALSKIKKFFPDIIVIMITAYEEVETVIAAMKLGAFDYIIKPIHMDGLEITIENALGTIKLRKEVQNLQAKYLKENIPCFIGESRAILDVMEFIETVSQSPDTPILLIGETGTGKELIASSIHYRSPNYKGRLITVNCAAIPKDLIESELFGYEKGAFSGALTSGKKGLIEEAANGTLFLDEVGDLGIEAQAKLLRFLEDGEFYRVGSTQKQKVQTRVVSATNKNLEEMIEQNLFRKDLYFRIGVIRVEIPSLNERREDIIPMAKHFLYEFRRKFKKDINAISPEAIQTLMAHNWTGNVRELKNIMERSVLTCKGTAVVPHNFGLYPTEPASNSSFANPTKLTALFPPLPASGVDLNEIEKAMERYYIEEAYNLTKGNESKAAQLLNLNHHTYRYRRKKLLEK